MFQTVASPEAGALASTFRDEYIQACRWMLLARTLDEKFASLYRAGKIHGGVFLGRGQEALSVSIGLALRKGDVFAPLIRDLAGRLAFGEPVLEAVRTLLGSALGATRGREGNGHRGPHRDGSAPARCPKRSGAAGTRRREAGGPDWFRARLLRMGGYGEPDGSSYGDRRLKQSPIGRACLKVAEEQLLQQRWADGLAI